MSSIIMHTSPPLDRMILLTHTSQLTTSTPLSYSGMVSIVFTWNFKFLYCFLYFYNYKQVILFSQTHQKKLERIDKVDEIFWPLFPSDTRRDGEEIESDNGKRKYGTNTSTPMLPRDMYQSSPRAFGSLQIVQDLSTRPFSTTKYRMILFPCSSRPTHSATISLSFSATKPTTTRTPGQR